MTNEQMKKKIEELERQVKELLEWKRAREVQQLSFPLDRVSKTIITTS